MVDELRRKRGFAKVALTRLEKNMSQMTETTTAIDISIQLEQLEKVYSKLNNLDEEIVQVEKSELNSEVAEFEKRYFALKSKLRTALKNQTDKEVNEHMNGSLNRLTDQQRELVQSIHETSFIQKDEVKLQAVQIPSFSGNYAEFQTFKDLFEVTIHKSHLSKIHKFKYLKGVLQGEAFNLIRHMTVTEANYDEAWNKIVQRYDVKDQICGSLIKQFLEQPQSNGCPRSVRHLADKTDEVLRGLKALGKEAEERDVWLNYLLLQKCDVETRKAWALENEEGFPKIETLLKFLVKRTNALERAEPHQPKRNQPKLHMAALNVNTHSPVSFVNVRNQDTTRSNKVSCPKCNNEHYLFSCEAFIKLPLEAKREFVLSKQLCFICMKSAHSYRDCRSKYRCTLCKGRHNSLLHAPRASIQTDTKEDVTPVTNSTEISNAHVEANTYSAAILPTALVRVKDALGNFHLCKAMLDSGSQASFIDGKLANKLQLHVQKTRITVSGLATRGLVTRGMMELDIYPRDHERESIKANALLLDRMSLVSNPPRSTIQEEKGIFQLKLADPEFYSTAKIKLLLGADVFFAILRREQHISNNFVAQNTIFGYVIAGCNKISNAIEPITLNLQLDLNIEETLAQFWQTEESPLLYPGDAEDHPAEVHFKETVKRAPDGRFVVKLPFKTKEVQLGNSYYTSLKRLEHLERKLSRKPALNNEYASFITEYEALGHMRKTLTTEDDIPGKNYFLPHHAVIREDSVTTKLRVVFDASCRTSNGTSLNNLLMVGPTIQPTLWIILLHFRKHKYVITADIQKMYRQIWLDEADINYQKILWRHNHSKKLQSYQLLTVTYGTACAPFLATRCLKQLALEEGNPIIKEILLNNFYVDDLLTGANSKEQLVNLKLGLSATLAKAGFKLHKWTSNIVEGAETTAPEAMQLPTDSDIIKILGLQWIPNADAFTFKVEPMVERTQTKRIMLSESSRIFDPLGWISPSIITCKTIFQQLWLRKLSWDDELPNDLDSQWRNIRKELTLFEQIRIPRFINHIENEELVEYHGFSDASQIAYAAVVYCRIRRPDQTFKVSLVTAKSRVAPLKPITIPRLELCAAQLLSELLIKVTDEFSVPTGRLFAWTDSMVVLSWLSSHPSNWKQFIRNRTAAILDNI